MAVDKKCNYLFQVSWYELNTKGRHELKSGASEDSYTLNVTDIRGDRYFFCQVSNCKGEVRLQF